MRKASVLRAAASAGYFLVLTISADFLFWGGMAQLAGYANIPLGILLLILTCAVWYLATAFFVGFARPLFAIELQGGELPCPFRSLPKLAAVLGAFAGAFAVLSGLLALLVFYGPGAGLPGAARRTPVLVCVFALALLSLPFFADVFVRFAHGEAAFRRLFSGSVRMGFRRYAKELLLCAAAFGLVLLIRSFAGALAFPAGLLLTIVLTSIVLGILLTAVFAVCSKAALK